MKTGNKYRDAEEEGYFPAPEEDEYLENERDISRTPPCLTFTGIVLAKVGLVRNGNSRKYCDAGSLTGELNRIKNQVNTLIHEHANI